MFAVSPLSQENPNNRRREPKLFRLVYDEERTAYGQLLSNAPRLGSA